MERLLPLVLVGFIIPTADLSTLLATAISSILTLLTWLKDQLIDLSNKAYLTILWVGDKTFHTGKFMFEYFPYDNYQRSLIVGLLALLVFTSLLVVFGVTSSIAPKIIQTYGLIGRAGVDVPDYVGDPSEITIGIGSEVIRKRVGVIGDGGSSLRQGITPSTIPLGEDPTGGDGISFGDTDNDNIPDQSDKDIDGDGLDNNVDTDIDGDGKDNLNDDTPCGQYISCPFDKTEFGNDTLEFSICGNGFCQEFVTATKFVYIDASLDDNILYYNIPYYCLSTDLVLEVYEQYGTKYVGIVGTKYLQDSLDDSCFITTSNEIMYSETENNCPEDCIVGNDTVAQFPNWCFNAIFEPELGEEGNDCGGQCAPCHCVNGVQDFDETGTDCGASCPECVCITTGQNRGCANEYCCPAGTGICTNRCVLRVFRGTTIPTCCHVRIPDGVLVCTEEYCLLDCKIGVCTLSQPQISNTNATSIGGGIPLIWQ